MQMTAHAQFDAALARQRRLERRSLQLPASVLSDRHGRVRVELLNLSATGLMLHAASARFEPGEQLEIELADGARMAATVVWAGDGFHGLGLSDPLSKGTFAAALLRAAARPQPDPAASPAAGSPDLRLARAAPRGTPTRLHPRLNFAVPVCAAVMFWTVVGSAAWLL